MKQITVKAYGLINVTKKQYIITQGIVFTILLILLFVSFVYDIDAYMLGNATIFVSIIILLECIETFFMFKQFRKKEIQGNRR